MRSRKELLNISNLYLILDAQVKDYNQLFEMTEKAVKAGIKIFQIRDKNGSDRDILQFCERVNSLVQDRVNFIVNDRVDLALAGHASGVHLGQNDTPIQSARQRMGDNSIIGVSCQTLAQARKAQKEGADYIGFGSVYKTLTKPDREPMELELLRSVVNEIEIPVFAIGGINVENIKVLMRNNVKYVAVCRALLEAENLNLEVAKFNQIMGVS